jgi:hypothetical protein
MLRYLFPILIAAAMSLCLSGAEAAPKSIKDCDKIQAADAYNLCLASFGPVAHEHDLKPVPAGIGSGNLYGLHHHGRRSAARYSHHRGRSYARRRGRHRQQMEISVVRRHTAN